MIKKTMLALAILPPLGIGATSAAAETISECGPVTAPGTYTVTTNITAPAATNCITISASGVSIDLQGHTISGSGFSSGIISTGQQQNIIIANGTITGFNQNINMNVNYLTISNINALNAGFSGINNAGSFTVVSDTQANHNGKYGIYFYGNNNIVYRTTANYNGQDGMAFLQQSATNTVSDGTANGNGQHGIYFANGNSTVNDSSANNNTSGDGIFAGGSNNVLTSNTANGNGSHGISVVCPSNLYGNTANDNHDGNIVTPGTGCVLLGNHAP
jgi:hypothetical protein